MKKQRHARWWLHKHLMKAHSSALRLKHAPSPEAVHDFRVALRRVRTLMKAYGPFLDKGISHEAMRALHLMSQSLGLARDPHVFQKKMVQLGNRFGHSSLPVNYFVRQLRKEERQRVTAVRRMLPQYFLIEEKLLGVLQEHGPGGSVPSSYIQWAQKWLLKRRKKLKKALHDVESPDDRCLHKARIHAKKLRYVAETLANNLKPAKTSVKIMKDAQTVLGDIHDLICLERYARKRRAKNGILLEALQTDKQILFEKNKKRLFSTPQKLKDQLNKL